MGNEVTVQNAQSQALQMQIQYAKLLADSSLLPAEYQKQPANVLLAIGLGQQVGLTPQESLISINVIKGKPTMSAQLIEALVRRAGHQLYITHSKQGEPPSATCTIYRREDVNHEHPFTETRDQKWAEQMGLAGRDNYKKQPLTMLTWRAITACAREACAEALHGLDYTPDEMHDLDQPTVTVERTSPHRLTAIAKARKSEAKQLPASTTKPAQKAEISSSEAGSAKMITPQQNQIINLVLRSVGADTEAKAKTFLKDYLPHPVSHLSDLTEQEAAAMIDRIRGEK